MATRDEVTDRPRIAAQSNRKFRNADRDGRCDIEQADKLKSSASCCGEFAGLPLQHNL
jgi:hypothetical protein